MAANLAQSLYFKHNFYKEFYTLLSKKNYIAQWEMLEDATIFFRKQLFCSL